MFRNITSQLTATGSDAEAKKVMSPTLRQDIYSAADQVKAWMIGGIGGGSAGDGVSYNPILSTIQKHFPNTKIGIESMGGAESECAIIVGGVTNMVLELCKWEGMAGGMAMRTWIDAVVEAYGRVPAGPADGSRKEAIAKGITRGINQNTDVTLVPKEFTVKIQVISILKTGEWVRLVFVFSSTASSSTSPSSLSSSSSPS